MNRREFLWSAALLGRVGARLNGSRFGMPAIGRARLSAERPAPLPQSLTADGWRIFEITTHVHVQNASRVTRAWLPTPLVGGVYQQTLGDTYHAESGTVLMVETEELDLLYAEWPSGADPILTLTSRVATRDHAVDVTTPTVAPTDLSRLVRSTGCSSAWRAQRASRRATSTPCASRRHGAASKASASRPTWRRGRSTAARRSISSGLYGCRSTPPTCGRLRSKNRRAPCRSATRRCATRARACSDRW